MYAPPHFTEERLAVLHALIVQHPLGTLVTQADGVLCADHLPFEIVAPTPDAPYGTLRCHVARANELWRRSGEALVVFQGPQAYISPAWYAEKARSGKVVPTFNYAVVHAHGTPRVIDDPAALLALLERLTARHEAQQVTPWRVAGAPPDYIAGMLAAIVGIEIPLTRLQGKWKISQNRPALDQQAIAAALEDTQPAMAALIAKNISDRME